VIENGISGIKASKEFETFKVFKGVIGVKTFKAINEMSSRGGEASGAAASDPKETAAPRVSAALPGSDRVSGFRFWFVVWSR